MTLVSGSGGGGGLDTTAIHKATAAEISAMTQKVTPTGSDHLVIEDAAAANAKKRILISALPGSSGLTVFNVQDYGATGDGVTDDSSAIASAASAADAVGGTLYFPAGTYLTTWFGISQGTSILGAGVKATIIKNTTASNGFTVRVTGSGGDGSEEMGTIEEIAVFAVATGTSGVLLTDTVHYTLRNVFISCSLTAGGARIGTTCFRSEYSSAGSSRTRLDNVNVRRAVGSGFEFDGGVADWCNRNSFTQCVAYQCATGWKFMSGSDGNWGRIETEDCDVGIDMGDSQETELSVFCENDTTALDLNACNSCTFYVNMGGSDTYDIDASGTANHNVIMGRFDESKINASYADLYDGENILIRRPNGSQEAIFVGAQFNSPKLRNATRSFPTGAWPTSGSLKAVAYLDFGNTLFTGTLQVDLVGGFNSGQATGLIRAVISFHHVVGGTSLVNMEFDTPIVHGPLATRYKIGPPEIHTTNQFRIPIYRLDTTTTSAVTATVTAYTAVTGAGALAMPTDVLDACSLVAPATGANSEVANVPTTSNGDAILYGQGSAVSDASGGATVDAEARTAINGLLAELRTLGVIAT